MRGPAPLACQMQCARALGRRARAARQCDKRRTDGSGGMERDLAATVIECAEDWAIQLDRAAAACGTPGAARAEEALLGAIGALLDAIADRRAALAQVPTAARSGGVVLN